MSRILFAFALLAPGLFSCKKEKNAYCSFTYTPTGGHAGFKGFDTTELCPVIRRSYVADGQFSSLLSTDTIFTDSLRIQDDTAWTTVPQSFFLEADLDTGRHYEIEIPAAMRIYRIAGVFYRGPLKGKSSTCDGRGRIFLKAADSTVVDGVPTIAAVHQNAISLFFLVK